MQEFFINKGATLPLLKMELINDGRYDYNAFYQMIQNSTITFTMTNKDTGIIKVSNSPAYLAPKESCDDKYFIYYPWNIKDTKIKGTFYGKFTIIFGDVFGGGTLIVPIQDELIIYVQ